jgi:DtxR family Mn-dependent transcriptional regulator
MPDFTAPIQDYLKSIWTLGEWSSEPVTVSSLAERQGVSASAASEAVRRMAERGLVVHQRYGHVELTDSGRSAALAMVRRHRLLEAFLVRQLAYAWDEVHAEAEVLEHAVSDLFVDRVDALLGHPARDPHGDPIPTADGHIDLPVARALSDLREGDTCRVVRVSDANPELLRFLDQAGIRLDADLTVLERRPFLETVTVRTPQREDLSLGLGAARAVWVSAAEQDDERRAP